MNHLEGQPETVFSTGRLRGNTSQVSSQANWECMISLVTLKSCQVCRLSFPFLSCILGD